MTEFTQREYDILAQWLASSELANKAMPMTQLEGYLFALICAPTPISEEVWIDKALGGQLASLSDDKLFALMGFHNAVSDIVFEQGYRVSTRVTLEEESEKNLSQNAELHLWALGFSQGIAHYIETIVTSQQLNEGLHEALAMTLGYLCFFADLSHSKTDCSKVLPLLDDFSEGFAALIEACVIDADLVDDSDGL